MYARSIAVETPVPSPTPLHGGWEIYHELLLNWSLDGSGDWRRQKAPFVVGKMSREGYLSSAHLLPTVYRLPGHGNLVVLPTCSASVSAHATKVALGRGLRDRQQIHGQNASSSTTWAAYLAGSAAASGAHDRQERGAAHHAIPVCWGQREWGCFPPFDGLSLPAVCRDFMPS